MAVNVPDQPLFEGPAVHVPDQLPFEGTADNVPLQPPFELPAVADNVPDQASQVADNCLITPATDLLPAADLVDDPTVLTLPADYNYQLLVGQQLVPSDKVLLEQLADNSLTMPAAITASSQPGG